MTRSEKQSLWKTGQQWVKFDDTTKFRFEIKNRKLMKLILALALKEQTGAAQKIEELLLSKLKEDVIYENFLNADKTDIEINPVLSFIPRSEQNLSQQKTTGRKSQ